MNEQLQEIADRVDSMVEEMLAFLDSPGGRRLRQRLATGLILSVPLVMRLPWLRRSPLGRMIEVGGGAVIVVKIAELMRDWERNQGGDPQLSPAQDGAAPSVPPDSPPA